MSIGSANDSSTDQQLLVVGNDSAVGKRLDRFLSESFPEKSRTRLQRLIDEGQVFVNGIAQRPSYKVRRGDKVCIAFAKQSTSQVQAEAIPLAILYEDQDLAVVDKPAGMIVHSGAGVRRGTLVNALLYHFKELSRWGGTDRPGIVHRLDRQTSGLIVIAKTDLSHQHLAKAFQSRQVTKHYVALVHGNLPRETGEITSPIGRDRVRRIKMSTRARMSRPAHTRYRVIERLPPFTLLEVNILTGRTHQIRAHLSSIKHPVVGDTLYGAPGRIVLARSRSGMPTLKRNFLHAAELEFNHPSSGKRLNFTAPLPPDLQDFLFRLRSELPQSSASR